MKYLPYAISGFLIGLGMSVYARAYHRDAMRISDRNWGDAVRYKPEDPDAGET